ncbi:ABC transporter permease [Desulfosarcina sp.]|nr:ABC transporter permease [Desulfosarcina sp.]
MKQLPDSYWTEFIEPHGHLFDLKLKELWKYRDLIYLFVHRDFVAQYKQTILGPAWYFIQPLFTTVIFTIIFGKIAQISTDGSPPFLFYMAGTVIWTFFASILTSTSSTFTGNAGIFGKVYFPRLAVPVAHLFSRLIAFLVQFIFFLCFLGYFIWQGSDIQPNIWMLVTPLLLLMMAGLGFGLGIIISAMTTRYRDLTVLVGFGVTLLMYASPIIYPLSILPEKWQFWLGLNPITPIVELFRYTYLGTGSINLIMLGISFVVISGILVIGILLFNKVERTFMDTV